MVIGVIQASSQTDKNAILYDAVQRYAAGHEVINFGCFPDDAAKYSYIEVSIMIGILLGSKAVDFVVTGCSSGQGMMLACNNMPSVLCGYVPTPDDAYLFAQINNGNAVSLPLGEEYTYCGRANCEKTIERLFCEPFGQGYPKSEAARKIKDTQLLKEIRKKSQVSFVDLLDQLDSSLIRKVFLKTDVIACSIEKGTDAAVTSWLKQHRENPN